MSTSFSLVTAASPGAIGLIQLNGDGVCDTIERLIGRAVLPGRCSLAKFGEIDEGVVAVLREDWAQLMPHGGPRVMQRLAERLTELGASPVSDGPSWTTYSEAASELEADMLATLAGAASPAAIDLLLAQPKLWNALIGCHGLGVRDQPVPSVNETNGWADSIQTGKPFYHIVTPPSVVLVGPPNVGKSTLTNLIMGRSASITADLPGTTRDWVAGLAEIPTPLGPLAVRWFDTPGLRDSDDHIEQKAIDLARRIIDSADVLIAMTDPDSAPPELGERNADIRVMNKCDLKVVSGAKEYIDTIRISATKDTGLDFLFAAIYQALELDKIRTDWPIAFSDRLQFIVQNNSYQYLQEYIGM